ncbi:MAG TPA: LCP family protein [Dermatophilaceae bacterium]|nr:LCP family protein [Actinomycetales bacterium]HMT31901.1 LCP family protein [Dermatophilaceae bacterium]HMT90309.1 LCP family protein [Dermatophilaceae bacterium]
MTSDPRRPLPDGVRARRRVAAARMARRSATLTILSTLFPGSGLTQTRFYKLGWLVVTLAAGTVAALAAVVFAKGPTAAALAVAVRPGALLIAAGLIAVAGVLWVLTIWLTHRGTMDDRLDRVQRVGLRALSALLCVVIAVPMATAVRYSLIQRDVIGTLFGQSGDVGTDGEAARPSGGADPWADVPRVNVLLIGSDAGDDRIGVRTDSMMIASIEPKTGQTILFSFPRNMQNVPFPMSNPLYKIYPKGYTCGSECLLNAVWHEAEVNHPELFKGIKQPGLYTIKGVLQEISGLRIDYTTTVDLKGFEALVNAMGGVVINVKEKLPIGGHVNAAGNIYGVDSWIQPGVQLLDGFHALWYARSRITSDDFGRMRRQRCLVGKLIGQVNVGTMLSKYPALAQVAKDNVQMDIPPTDLPAWAELVNRVKGATISSLAFTPDNINPGNPNFVAIRRMVREAIDPSLVVPPSTTSVPSTTSKTPTKKPTATKTPTSTKSPSSTTSTPPPSAPVDLEEAC